jgi:hypothetical protein
VFDNATITTYHMSFDHTFENAKSLRVINIQKGIANFGYFACKNCESLERILYSEGKILLGYNSSFQNCKSLSAINALLDTTNEISQYAFENVNMDSLSIYIHTESYNNRV